MDTPKFSLVHINIRGLRSNLDNLSNYLSSHNYPEIVTLNETKLNVNQEICVPNYICIARKEKRGCQHGSLILKRNDINDVVSIGELNQFQEEVIGIRINGNSTRPTINVITYYNPPNTAVNPSILRVCRSLRGRSIITGDLNCKHVAWGSTKNDQHGHALLKSINDNQLFVLNDGSMTRYDPSSGKEQVLDLMLTNGDFLPNFSAWNVDEDIGSDHYPIRATFSLNLSVGHTEMYRSMKNTDWKEFKTLLSDVQTTSPSTAEEIDVAVEHVTKRIINAFELTCPLRQKRHHKSSSFTSQMVSMVREKRRLRRLKSEAKRQDDDLTVAELQRKINKINYDLKKEQKLQQKQHVRSLCHELNTEKNTTKIFGLFDKIRGRRTKPEAHCNISDNGATASTDKDKAELFAKRLERLHQTRDDPAFNQEWKASVEDHVLSRKNIFCVDKNGQYLDPELGDDNRLLTSISQDEIREQLTRCKNRSAPGEDGLSYAVLKRLPNNVVSSIQSLFNASLTIGYFPEEWKTAAIKMVPKHGKDNKEAKNWRPISLISCLGKLFERIVTSRLSSYLESEKLLSPSQSGFRKGRMTTEQLFRLSEDAHSFIKKKGITAALFLDAEAAFDQAWHDAIRYKLDKLNLPHRFIRLLSSFLTDRKLKVKVGKEVSQEVKMKAGTPQGSCLSPLLYIILVNDVPAITQTGSIGQFADDIGLWSSAFTTGAAVSRLQKSVNEVEGWCRRWRIKLNGSKSNLLLISRLNKKTDESHCIQLFNDIVRPCSSARYLGIQFDEKLRFKEHFKEIESKAASRLNLFKLLVKSGVANVTLIRLYKIYVRPLFEYGSVSFLPARIMSLQRIQNEFIRLCLRLPAYIRTDLVHQSAGLQMLKNRLSMLNNSLLQKMLKLEDIQKTVEKSLAVVPLNNYKSPLDFLIDQKTKAL